MTRTNIVAIDNGTQSVRALLITPDGKLLAKSRVVYEPYFSKHPGWAEQHPEVFWKNVCKACQELLSFPDVDPNTIAGVTLTTQRSTLINLDENYQPLRPAIHWLDQRIAKNFKPVSGIWGFIFNLLGLRDTIN